jgi:FAD/FMN-containing dehydrogenase
VITTSPEDQTAKVVAPEEFVTAFNGSLVGPDDVRYDEVRAVHNSLVDKRPGLIAECHNVADVRDALAFGRDAGLEISVRGGGHNVAGLTLGGALGWLMGKYGMSIDNLTAVELVTADGAVRIVDEEHEPDLATLVLPLCSSSSPIPWTPSSADSSPTRWPRPVT